MATREKTKSVRLRWNCDYMSHFVWTHELNRDVYQYYNKARENPKISCMKRMKQYWDNLHTGFTNSNEKQMRKQATFVESEGLILETHLQPTTTNRNENSPEITELINTDVLNDDVMDITDREKFLPKFTWWNYC